MGEKVNPLNILVQCRSLSVGKGGVERIAVELANEMARRSHFVHIGYKNYGPPAYSVGDAVKLIPYDSDEGFIERVHLIDPDVFFVFYTNQLVIKSYAMVSGSNIPFAIQEASNPMRVCCDNWRSRKMNRSSAMWEREIVASAAVRIRLTMPSYKVSFPRYVWPQIRAFSNPAFPQKYFAKPAGEYGKRKTILNINGFKQNKNLRSLVQAFSRLAITHHEWDLRIVGKLPDGKSKHQREILDIIENSDIQKRVFIEGPTDDLSGYYASAHIHAISSLSEGCPTVVLEAMSVGLPSIGYGDCAGTNELIRHESNGLLAGNCDRVSGLEVELDKLMTSADLRRRLGVQALEDAKRFNPRQIYDSWEELFYEAAEYKNDPGRLFREQAAIDAERALHAKRMREKLIQELKENR
jgi:glycosyltransferase involved in cell wall biosynthesis